jgi:hypothetical protein
MAARKKKALSLTAILDADDLVREAVDVPEWGGTVYVSTMTASERDSWEAGVLAGTDAGGQVQISKDALENMRARLAVLVVCNEEGTRLFTDEHVAALGAKAAPALQRIFDVAKRLNRLGEDDIAELTGN